MNGSWFNFGQDPTGFITAWRRAYDTITARIGASNRDKVAFVWAPNSGNGYPYPGGIASPTPTDPRFQLLDTNKDGVFNTEDNAYSPYYPGDAYVDWVGLSIYHYGSQWPWLQNVVPESNKFEGLMQGSFNPAWGNFPFYDEFSGTLNRTGVTAGNKPFILAEGGATFHVSLNDIGRGKNFAEPDVTTTSRSSIKKAFWSSFLNTDFLAKYPNFKAACTFEFIKSEEDTVRDFSNFGPPPTNRTGNEDGDAVAAAFVEDAKGMTFVKWAGSASTLIPTTGAPPAVRTGATTTNAPVKTGVPVVVTTTTTRTGGAEKGGVVGVASAVMVLASFFAFM
ncbi:hypothetical protein BC829DRAFT_403290 [Chytridium lagenaria]|nr:hypothetical protein BC829DRAFT_403290 [Chytridium lagenaria]